MSDGGHDHDEHHHHEPTEPPGLGGHGMLIVGTASIWASHLPMFHAPHDFQLHAEVDFEEAEAYRKDRRTSGEPLYTLNPEVFSWDELLPKGDVPPARTSFTAKVHRGHFERGGEAFLHDVTVEIRRIAYVSQLSPDDPPSSNLTYRCLGGPGERFLAHEIHGAPSFDHVVSVRFEEPSVEEMDLAGQPAVLQGRADRTEDRLRPGEVVTASFPQTSGPEGEDGFTTQVTVLEEAYLEVGELKR